MFKRALSAEAPTRDGDPGGVGGKTLSQPPSGEVPDNEDDDVGMAKVDVMRGMGRGLDDGLVPVSTLKFCRLFFRRL